MASALDARPSGLELRDAGIDVGGDEADGSRPEF
jgi:hypothetical protein